MAVSNADLLDLTRTTLKDLPKQKFEAAWDYQQNKFCQIYHESKVQVDGGTSIQRNIVFDHSGNARYRQLYDTDAPGVSNIQNQIDVPWTQVGTNYSWDVVEIRRQMNSAKGYINLLKSRRLDGMWALANLIEERGWLAPATSTDTTNPYGIPYYLNMLDAAVTTGGFLGQTIRFTGGTTSTVCAGIDASLQPKWKNYADVYTKVDNDLLRKLRKAFLKTRFQAAPMVQAPGNDSPGARVEIYVDDTRATELMDLADKRDDMNTGKELAGKALINDPNGVTMFNRRPVCYVPLLDGVTYSPIYCVDWSKIQPIVQDGYWMEESEPMSDRTQHTVLTIFVDGSHQNLCINRRTAGFVLHTVTA